MQDFCLSSRVATLPNLASSDTNLEFVLKERKKYALPELEGRIYTRTANRVPHS